MIRCTGRAQQLTFDSPKTEMFGFSLKFVEGVRASTIVYSFHI